MKWRRKISPQPSKKEGYETFFLSLYKALKQFFSDVYTISILIAI
jgi:hypothetical protein